MAALSLPSPVFAMDGAIADAWMVEPDGMPPELNERDVLGLIDPANEMLVVEQRGSLSLAFIAENPNGGWDYIVIAPKRGEFFIFKTMFGQKENRSRTRRGYGILSRRFDGAKPRISLYGGVSRQFVIFPTQRPEVKHTTPGMSMWNARSEVLSWGAPLVGTTWRGSLGAAEGEAWDKARHKTAGAEKYQGAWWDSAKASAFASLTRFAPSLFTRLSSNFTGRLKDLLSVSQLISPASLNSHAAPVSSLIQNDITSTSAPSQAPTNPDVNFENPGRASHYTLVDFGVRDGRDDCGRSADAPSGGGLRHHRQAWTEGSNYFFQLRPPHFAQRRTIHRPNHRQTRCEWRGHIRHEVHE